MFTPSLRHVDSPYGITMVSRWRAAVGERAMVDAMQFSSGPSYVSAHPSELIPSWGRNYWFDPGYSEQSSHRVRQTMRIIDAWGWPFRALCGGYETPESGVRIPPNFQPKRHWAIVTPHWRNGMPRAEMGLLVLPLHPLWMGFAGNAALYGLVATLLVWSPRALFRWWRASPGTCAGCGYPMGVSPNCTECGRIHAPTADGDGGAG